MIVDMIEVLEDKMNDPRLAKMHAIVFLGVKPKGRAKDDYHSLSTEKYNNDYFTHP